MTCTVRGWRWLSLHGGGAVGEGWEACSEFFRSEPNNGALFSCHVCKWHKWKRVWTQKFPCLCLGSIMVPLALEGHCTHHLSRAFAYTYACDNYPQIAGHGLLYVPCTVSCTVSCWKTQHLVLSRVELANSRSWIRCFKTAPQRSTMRIFWIVRYFSASLLHLRHQNFWRWATFKKFNHWLVWKRYLLVFMP